MTVENKNIHNALRQIRIPLPKGTLKGFSISGLATYHQIPEFDFAVDLGECPLSAIALNHVFLTHAHGDHSRCLMRHHSLRKMTGISKDASYYIPECLAESAKNWIKAEALFENVPEYKFRYPTIIPLKGKEKHFLSYRKDLAIEAFDVEHSVPAMGCTLYNYKKKLRPEFFKCSPSELITLKESGKTITDEVYSPLISFMGDTKKESFEKNPEVFNSEVLVTECTFIDDNEEEMAKKKSHLHLHDLIHILNDFRDSMKCKIIVLNHFSMKYSEKHILETIEAKLPENFKEIVKVLI